MICAKVDLELLDQLGLYEKNVFWMCDHCAALFSNGHFRNIVSRDVNQTSVAPNAVDSMKEDIEKLNSAVIALAAKVESKIPVSSTPRWPKNDRFDSGRGTPKRRRTSFSTDDKPILCGKKAPIDSVRTVDLNDDLVWVYLSAFHPTTTNDEISFLVSKCLCLETDEKPRVAKLVPRGKDPSTLNYVSFKVGVNQNKRDVALSCDSWPEGIQFREFDDSRSKKVTKITRIGPAQ
ncbi:uncharacterized protein LOC135704952 [Ochlerotatus camptorhynchus]|uniref:uncharacterized protein LOC135704952 n=1 Tax=Ochlerotatus camptorhynchus TaxID=644619 RepID=UPI0031D01F44